MSTYGPENWPDLGEQTASERIHNRIMDAIRVAEEMDSELVQFDADPESGDADISFYITGLQGEDPILITDSQGRMRYINADISVSEEYGDVAALGRDADGRPAPIMQLDEMAELQTRTIDILMDFSNSPEGWGEDRPKVYESGWRIHYDADKGWRSGFWKNFKFPQVTGKPEDWVKPTQDDIDVLRILLDQADKAARS